MHKKTENTQSKFKIILLPILIPFLYMLLSLVEYVLTYPFYDPTHHPILWTEWIAGYFLFFIGPIIIITFSVTPKLSVLTEYRKFIEYLYISSWVFVFIFWYIAGIIYDYKVQ